MGGQADQVKGHAKEAAGVVTGNEQLESEGKTDRMKGKAEEKIDETADKVAEGVESAKDKVEELADKAKDALKND